VPNYNIFTEIMPQFGADA